MGMEDVGHIHGGPIIGLLSLTKIMPHRISDSFDQLCDLDANLQCYSVAQTAEIV